MADRKAEKERLRQARLDAERRDRADQRRKLLLGYGVAGLLTLLVLAGIIYVITQSGDDGVSGGGHILGDSGDTHGLEVDERDGPAPPEQVEFDHEEAARKASCTLREDLPDEGNVHIGPGDEAPDYKTNPPTSGDHIEPPLQQADGAYLEPADPVNWVHSLEHGRIAILYSPDLPEEQQLELRGLYDEMYGGALFFPYPDMPYDVAAVAWRNLVGCERYEGLATLDAIRAFGIEKFGEGPEDVLAFGELSSVPTPAAPGEDPPDS